MTLHIDQELCIACQSCTVLCPAVFALDVNYKVQLVDGFDEEAASDEVKKAVEESITSCPVQAIKR